MKAAIYQGKQRFEIKDVPVPTTGPGQILVKVKYCGICGTDVHGYMYDVVPPGSMMGHEYGGTVAEVGEGVANWKVGERVVGGGGKPPPGTTSRFGRGPRFNYRTMGWQSQPAWARAYAEYVQMEAWQPVPLPEGVSDKAAAMAEPLATAVHAVRRSGLRVGDSVGILGAGPVGLFCLQVVRAGGASPVIVAEPAPARTRAALDLGADAVIDPARSDVVSEMASLTDGRGPAVVFDCAGARNTLQVALEAVRQDGNVVIVALAWEPTAVLPVDWITRDLHLTTSFVHNADDWRIGLDMVKSGTVKIEPMLPGTSVIPLEDIQGAFESLTKPTTQIKVLVEP